LFALTVRVPKAVTDKEPTLRSESAKLIERGKVNITATAEYTDSTAEASSINVDLLQKYYTELQSIAQQLGDPKASLFELALNMPDVIAHKEEGADEAEGNVFLTAFYQAADKFNASRADVDKVWKDD